MEERRTEVHNTTRPWLIINAIQLVRLLNSYKPGLRLKLFRVIYHDFSLHFLKVKATRTPRCVRLKSTYHVHSDLGLAGVGGFGVCQNLFSYWCEKVDPGKLSGIG